MRIAAARIVLDFYNNGDLALKHRNLESLCDDIRRKFNVSALEVESLDDPERCVLGLAAMIPDTWKMSSAESFLEKLCQTIDASAFARVMSEQREFFYLE